MDVKKNIDDYESVDDIISSQTERKNHVSEVINLLQDQKFLEEDIKYAYSLICQFRHNTTTAKEEIKNMNQLLPKIKNLEQEVKCLESRIAYAEDNLPTKFNKLLAIVEDDYDKENVAEESICKNILTPLPIRRHLDFAEGVIPSAQKVFVQKEVQYLTQSEFSKIPGYMRGRVTYDAINSFVDVINKCLEEKYSLLHAGKSALKKRSDQEKFTLFKRQECPKTKGKRFITQDDLKTAMGGKIDKHTLNLIPMLRHTSRLQEVRDGGLVRYVAITDIMQM